MRGGLRSGRGVRRAGGRGHGRGGGSSRVGGRGGGTGNRRGNAGARGHARSPRGGPMQGNSPRSGRGLPQRTGRGSGGRHGRSRHGASGFYRGGSSPSMYPGLPDPQATSQTALPPFSIENADFDLAGADQHNMRPDGIHEQQEDVICHVAKYVVYSCDGAKYQQRLRQRTRHNPYFAFMDPRHPYYTYYAYLMESYRYWKAREEEGGGFLDAPVMMANEAATPMMGQGVAGDGVYGQFHELGSAFAVPSSSSEGLTGSGGQREVMAESHAATAHQSSEPHSSSAGGPAVGAEVGNGAQANEQDDDEDEDVDEDQYEMVMVNGVPTLVAKNG